MFQEISQNKCLSQLTQQILSPMGKPEIPGSCFGMLFYKRYIPLSVGDEFIIGRSIDSNLVLDDFMVSRKQCVIKQVQGHACLRVFGKIMVNNLTVNSGFYLLNDYDVLTISKDIIIFHSQIQERNDQDLILFDHNYCIGPNLASGGYADVHCGMNILSGQLVAIKITDIRVYERHTADKEIEFQDLKHKNVAGVFESISSNKLNYLIMEYFGGRDLHYYMSISSPKEDVTKWIMYQLFIAVQHIHNNGVIHQDLKPENIVLDYSMDTLFPRCAISDFGLSVRCACLSDVLFDLCGTFPFIPPETILKKGHSFKFDSWSLGIIMVLL
eukprot:NODE_112_length_19362_cov_0.399678.p7 type:complete len:327 gc:universal NODE_112_length_19362_cov_0.399678:17751-16771(-)